jgi:hypothetical protein
LVLMVRGMEEENKHPNVEKGGAHVQA